MNFPHCAQVCRDAGEHTHVTALCAYAPPKFAEQCLNCEHYHASTCMVPVTLDSGPRPCGCDWN